MHHCTVAHRAAFPFAQLPLHGQADGSAYEVADAHSHATTVPRAHLGAFAAAFPSSKPFTHGGANAATDAFAHPSAQFQANCAAIARTYAVLSAYACTLSCARASTHANSFLATYSKPERAFTTPVTFTVASAFDDAPTDLTAYG